MERASENYYQILRVSRRASHTDILAAYHAAKGAFNKESLAATGFKTPPDITSFLQKIEKAYETLSDPIKRQSYDDLLELAAHAEQVDSHDAQSGLPKPFTGLILRGFRESLGLSLEEVFRITRIPVSYLRAIEEEQREKLPARVYLQGFLKSLAQVYKLPPQDVAKLFLEHFDKNLSHRD